MVKLDIQTGTPGGSLKGAFSQLREKRLPFRLASSLFSSLSSMGAESDFLSTPDLQVLASYLHSGSHPPEVQEIGRKIGQELQRRSQLLLGLQAGAVST